MALTPTTWPGCWTCCYRIRQGGTRVVGFDAGKPLPCDPAILTDPESWHLTDADEDT